MKSILLSLVLFCFFQTIFAQNFESNYDTLNTSSEQSTIILKNIALRHIRDSEKIPQGYYHKKIQETYEERYERIKSEVISGSIITDSLVRSYFDVIIEEIIDSNPSISKDVDLLLYRSEFPNASCHGEGTLYLNIGLLSRLENESQVAFIICHEIAHYMKNHVDEAIANSIEKLNSKETKTELKKIKKSTYYQVTKLEHLFEGYVYDSRKHSRLNENDADSIGLEYLTNTKYDAQASISVLEILDKVKLHKYNEPIDYKKHFNSEEYPFKNRWLITQKTLPFSLEKEDEELLKTHPDCPFRIKTIKRLLLNYNSTGKQLFVQPKEQFTSILNRSNFEIIELAYDTNQLDLVTFQALQLLKKHPDNVYLHTMIGKAFYTLYRFRKAHNAFHYVKQPRFELDSTYNQHLVFLNNLRTSEISKVALSYFGNQDVKLLQNEEFFYTYLLCLAMKKDKQALLKAKQEYKQKFPNGNRQQDVEGFDILKY